jgi:hypothetical protein
MNNLLINKIDNQPINNPYNYVRIIEPFNQMFFIEENLQRILARYMQIEQQKNRINLSLNFSPKKILSTNTISFKILENTPINSDTQTNVNISLTEESSLKFYVEEGVSV